MLKDRPTKLVCINKHLRIQENLYPNGGCRICNKEHWKKIQFDPLQRVKRSEYFKQYRQKYKQTLEQKERYKISSKKYRTKPEVKKRNSFNRFKYGLKENYGLNYNEYQRLLLEQNYCCAVCGISEQILNKRLSVDHNHITGKVRGLLCSNCNIKIVSVVENFRHLISKAEDYLKQSVLRG